jgi:hypothetical protein
MKRYKLLLTEKEVRLIGQALFEYSEATSTGLLEGTKYNKDNLALSKALHNLNMKIGMQFTEQLEAEGKSGD